MKDFRLVYIDPETNREAGHDKALLIVPGAQVHLSGTTRNAGQKSHVVKHVEHLKLLIVKNSGYSWYYNSFHPTQYSPANFTVYEYAERIVGNEIHLMVDLFGIAELPLKWKPPT